VRPALAVSGATMGLGVIRGLGEAGVPVVSVHYAGTDMAHRSRYVRERLVTPRPSEDEPGFVRALLDAAPRFSRGLLMPASDPALVAVSRNRDVLAERYVVAAPAWSVAAAFIDKSQTYALAQDAGIPMPETIVPASREEAERSATRMTYPCLIKPSVGHLYRTAFGRKMTLVDDTEALLSAYDDARAVGLEVMIQELIPGPDDAGANYNAYVAGGRPLVEFTAVKVRSEPTMLGSPCVVRSEAVDEIVGPGRAILHAMGFEGFACAEFKRDPRDGIWKLMEVNGRHNLSAMLAIRCGINFPLLEYLHLMEGVEPSASGCRRGVYWIDLVRDLRGARDAVRRDGWGRFVRPYRGPRVFAVGAVRDPMPFIVQAAQVMRGAGTRVSTRVRRRRR